MKSPFPGMDPFIEACDLWEDFHSHIIARIRDVLADALPLRYVARTGKRSYSVLSRPKWDEPAAPLIVFSPAASDKPATVRDETAPVEMRAFIELEYEEQFIDIIELKPERRLVTSIEVLSPSNKKRRSPGWKKYRRKRQALLLGKANLVEIDLLRGGERMPMLDPWPTSPYTLLVAREERAPRCRVWPAFFDRPLPEIPIPLSRPDPDLTLALQPLIETIYERGRYRQAIDYSQPLTPPLSPEQTTWLQQQRQAETQPKKPRTPRPRRGRR